MLRKFDPLGFSVLHLITNGLRRPSILPLYPPFFPFTLPSYPFVLFPKEPLLPLHFNTSPLPTGRNTDMVSVT